MKSEICYSQDGKTVIKKCRTAGECEKELRVYRLALPGTPDLIKIIDERTLELKRIYGKSLSTESDFDFSKPAAMLSDLHKKLGNNEGKVLCHLDTNPRNYLIEEKTNDYYFIDFSESDFSLPENDLLNFLLFWAAILPPVDFKKGMKDFLSGYKAKNLLAKQRRDQYFQGWIDIFDERRRRFCKNPRTVPAYQTANREYIMYNFYQTK